MEIFGFKATPQSVDINKLREAGRAFSQRRTIDWQ
jgi:hypothetical protein